MKKISLIYIVLLALSVSIVAKADEETPILPEDFVSCSTGVDNDFDGLTGFLGDPDCEIFEPVEATTTEPAVVPVVVNTGFSGPSFGGGSSSGFSSGGITSGTPISGVISTTTTPSASTTVATNCSDIFKTYMKKGSKNDSSEVKKLQSFLNNELGLAVPVTGFFGNKTFDAVKQFQLKYRNNVLNPWNSHDASGYFYKTSLKQANLILCPAA